MAWKAAYKINLKSSFDRIYKDRPVPLKSKLRPLLSDSDFKFKVGQDVIDKIINRTSKKSIDKFGQSFVGYSDSYKKSLPYKVYRKRGKVNLKLTGELLASMISIDKSGNKIEITFIDDLNNAKAHGHIHGGNNLPVRDFLGLPEDELDKIVKKNINRFSEQNLVAYLSSSFERILDGI